MIGGPPKTPERSKRILKIILLFAVAGGIFAMACLVFPKILTGDFAEVTINNITTSPGGKVTVRFASVASYGTPVSVQLFKNRAYVGGTNDNSKGSLLRWPVRREHTISFNLDPEGIPTAGQFEDSPLFQRLLVQAGKTYRFKGEQIITLFDFQAKDGARYTGFIRVSDSLSGI